MVIRLRRSYQKVGPGFGWVIRAKLVDPVLEEMHQNILDEVSHKSKDATIPNVGAVRCTTGSPKPEIPRLGRRKCCVAAHADDSLGEFVETQHADFKDRCQAS